MSEFTGRHLLFGAKPWNYATTYIRQRTGRHDPKWRNRPPSVNRTMPYHRDDRVLLFCGVKRLVSLPAAHAIDKAFDAVTTRFVEEVTCEKCRVFLDGWIEVGAANVVRTSPVLVRCSTGLEARRMSQAVVLFEPTVQTISDLQWSPGEAFTRHAGYAKPAIRAE